MTDDHTPARPLPEPRHEQRHPLSAPDADPGAWSTDRAAGSSGLVQHHAVRHIAEVVAHTW